MAIVSKYNSKVSKIKSLKRKKNTVKKSANLGRFTLIPLTMPSRFPFKLKSRLFAEVEKKMVITKAVK